MFIHIQGLNKATSFVTGKKNRVNATVQSYQKALVCFLNPCSYSDGITGNCVTGCDVSNSLYRY